MSATSETWLFVLPALPPDQYGGLVLLSVTFHSFHSCPEESFLPAYNTLPAGGSPHQGTAIPDQYDLSHHDLSWPALRRVSPSVVRVAHRQALFVSVCSATLCTAREAASDRFHTLLFH